MFFLLKQTRGNFSKILIAIFIYLTKPGNKPSTRQLQNEKEINKAQKLHNLTYILYS